METKCCLRCKEQVPVNKFSILPNGQVTKGCTSCREDVQRSLDKCPTENAPLCLKLIDSHIQFYKKLIMDQYN